MQAHLRALFVGQVLKKKESALFGWVRGTGVLMFIKSQFVIIWCKQTNRGRVRTQ